MRIKVEHVFPPIPIRMFDWAVYAEDSICCDECPYTVGRGETKEAAWLDFAEQIAAEMDAESREDFEERKDQIDRESWAQFRYDSYLER